MVAEYRVYLRDKVGFIRAQQDFAADSLAEAIESASFLFDACSDQCASYELWCGTLLFAQKLTRPPPVRLEHVSEATQKNVVELEETLRQSHWAVAKSTRLCISLQAARRNGLGKTTG